MYITGTGRVLNTAHTKKVRGLQSGDRDRLRGRSSSMGVLRLGRWKVKT
jgi:hypothetical protein